MRGLYRISLTALLCFASFPFSAPGLDSAPAAEATAGLESAEKGALDTVARFAAALGAGDRKGVLATLAPEVVIFEHGGAESSRQEYADHHLDGDLEFLRTVEVQVLDRHAIVGQHRVIVLTRTSSNGQYRGQPVVSRGTETLVLERRGQEWQIVHVHWSSRKATGE